MGVGTDTRTDGTSFFPLLKGEKQNVRDHVLTSYNYAFPGIQAFPMRAVQSKHHLYIYNAWSSENNIWPKHPLVYYGEPLLGQCWKSMKEAAKTDPSLENRIRFIENRIAEEYYDLGADPYSLNNLITQEQHQDTIHLFKKILEDHLIVTQDPILDKYRGTGPIPRKWLIAKKNNNKS